MKTQTLIYCFVYIIFIAGRVFCTLSSSLQAGIVYVFIIQLFNAW